MKISIYCLVLFISLSAFSQNYDKNFERALIQLDSRISKDTLKYKANIDKLEKKIKALENTHNFNYEQVEEYVSVNLYVKASQMGEDFFNHYFSNRNSSIYESNTTFYNSFSKEEEEEVTSYILDVETIDMDSNGEMAKTNPNLDSYKYLQLDIREERFKYATLIFIIFMKENYDFKKLTSAINTDNFKFKEAMKMLNKMDKNDQEISSIIEPAIFDKSFKIGFETLYIK